MAIAQCRSSGTRRSRYDPNLAHFIHPRLFRVYPPGSVGENNPAGSLPPRWALRRDRGKQIRGPLRPAWLVGCTGNEIPPGIAVSCCQGFIECPGTLEVSSRRITRARGMIEHVTRDWVVRRRLSAEFARAPIHVTPSAGLRYLFRSMDSVDTMLLDLVREVVSQVTSCGTSAPTSACFPSRPPARPARMGSWYRSSRTPGWFSFSAEAPWNSPKPRAGKGCAGGRRRRGLDPDLCLANRSRAANYLAEFGTTQTGGPAKSNRSSQ